MTFEGKKIRLRPVKASDIDYSLKWRNQPQFIEMNLSLRIPVTEEMEKQWYEKVLSGNNSNKIVFAIEDKADNKLAGFVILSKIDWISKTGDFGISIGSKEKQGRGLGSEAMQLFFAYLFEYLNMRKINLSVAEYNDKAIQLYKRFGFKQEGLLDRQVYLNNTYHNIMLMALFKNDYSAEKNKSSVSQLISN